MDFIKFQGINLIKNKKGKKKMLKKNFILLFLLVGLQVVKAQDCPEGMNYHLNLYVARLWRV